uniref:tRNA (adenine(58)-N(1))-methyltransferase catalytic subunit TRMT61A n=1 Tax=Caligus clemensi TaxID=344056 RepID=C1C0S4_CALCM|nr:tRNA adenine-N1 methyltransferase catalytic subunit TRM61 [Caligus clemensi]
MSFVGFKETVEEKDVVILYVGFNNLIPLQVVPKKENRKGVLEDHVIQTCYGALRVNALIGIRYGTRVQLSQPGAYVHVLKPTPELWTKCLPHRTQILYTTDASMIIAGLELKSGSTVIESGTGSGSLSHALARVIGPQGKLYTFDFHEERSQLASKEFESHGLTSVIASHRDVCSTGFGVDVEVDAVFLDLPHPWEAIPHANKSLKALGRLCSFSPCIEQVQKASLRMKEEGFEEIQTLEVLLREFQVRKIIQQTYDHDTISNSESTPSSTNGNNSESEENGEPPSKKVKKVTSESIPRKSFVTGLPLTTMPGHTGYLTFATKPFINN